MLKPRNYICLLLLCFLLPTSCSGNKAKQKQIYTIGFSQCTDDRWRQIMIIQMQSEVTKYPNVKLIIEEAYNDTKKQIEQIQKFIDQKVDLLIISPNESQPITAVAVEAYQKGIPTIIWDRKIESDEYTTFISADNYRIGRDVGMYIQSILPKGSTILEIFGLEGSSPARERHQGFIDVVNEDYSIHKIMGEWSTDITRVRVEDIKDISNIDLVFGHNDDMAIAAYETMLKKDSVKVKNIKFIGIDAIVGVDAVINGTLEASFLYPPGGEFVIETAIKILKKEKVDKNYTLKSSIINKGNAETLKAQSDQIITYQRRINSQKKDLDAIETSYSLLKHSAYLIVLILCIVLPFFLYTIGINSKIRKKNKNLIEKNKQVEEDTQQLIIKNEQIENITNQKLQFFTNISHEVRTTLTLILNPLDKIAKKEQDPGIQKDIWTIQRNAKRLLRIVNQILDFRKVENNKMSLLLKEVDAISFTKEVLSYFEAYAESEKIVYKFSSDIPSQKIWIDAEKIEQVLMNLISNSFKNSQKYGIISVSVIDNKDSVIIEVMDNGRGIDPESQAHIFDRFYTISNSNRRGTGIGLHLSREYVEMHKGTIRVDSQPGKFTIFTVELPKGKDHFTGDFSFEEKSQIISEKGYDKEDNNVKCLLGKKYNETILIAEDDPDICNYLQEELSANFDVIVTNNGYEATKAVMDNAVSLVLSDVLMPQINGFQLCRNIKKNVATSHIPVILLTALSDDSQRIYGIAEGADEYIRKPFNIDYIKIKIIRILEERKQLIESFIKKVNAGEFLKTEIKDIACPDDIFKNKLFDLMDNSYEDGDCNIESMSDNLGMSRVQLYRKIKSIFGMTPTDLLRSFRLSKATEFLMQKKYSISEIAYMTGFSSPAYFARCFKKQFNKSPSDYVLKK